MNKKGGLINALTANLIVAKKRLNLAILKKDKWAVTHYKKDISIIKSEIAILNKKITETLNE